MNPLLGGDDKRDWFAFTPNSASSARPYTGACCPPQPGIWKVAIFRTHSGTVLTGAGNRLRPQCPRSLPRQCTGTLPAESVIQEIKDVLDQSSISASSIAKCYRVCCGRSHPDIQLELWNQRVPRWWPDWLGGL